MAWREAAPLPRAQPGGGFTIFGIPIHIDHSWLFVVAFFAWTLARGYFPQEYPGWRPLTYAAIGAVAALLLFACVLLHELGHSLVAKSHGIPVYRVTLFLFGGVAQIGGTPARPFSELVIALAGPLVSAAIAGLCVMASRMMGTHGAFPIVLVAIVRYLAMLNIGLILFNLLPGFPLDGGRVLRAALWAWTGNFRFATRIASSVGAALALGLIALGVWAIASGAAGTGLWYGLLGSFLFRAARATLRGVRG